MSQTGAVAKTRCTHPVVRPIKHATSTGHTSCCLAIRPTFPYCLYPGIPVHSWGGKRPPVMMRAWGNRIYLRVSGRRYTGDWCDPATGDLTSASASAMRSPHLPCLAESEGKDSRILSTFEDAAKTYEMTWAMRNSATQSGKEQRKQKRRTEVSSWSSEWKT